LVKGLASNNPILKEFIKHPNNAQLDLSTPSSRGLFSTIFTHGNAWLEIVTDAKMSFLYLYHVDTSKVRIATNLEEIIIHPDWTIFKGKNDENSSRLPLYPTFNSV
jgi:hypothetical protein